MKSDPIVYGTINDAALETLRRRLNVEHPISEPFIRHINADSARHAAHAIGDANPLWIDPEYGRQSRYRSLVAPPSILYGVSWGSWDMRRGEGLPGVHGLHAGDKWTYYRPLLDGDTIHATKKLVSLEEKQGSYSGRSVMQTRQFCYRNGRGEKVARCLMSALRVERHVGKSSNRYASTAKAKYTPDEIRAIDDAIRAEIVRGAQTRYWEDVEIGEAIQPIVRGPLTVSDMICWMMGMGSPHVRSGQFWLDYRTRSPKVAVADPESGIPQAVERVHWDPYLAAEIGMPAPYDYGAQRGAWATHLMTNWTGDEGWLAELSVQYRGMNFLGDTVWLSGEVVDKWQGLSGTGYVSCTIACINQRKENIMPGSAIVALPQRGRPLPDFPLDVDADR